MSTCEYKDEAMTTGLNNRRAQLLEEMLPDPPKTPDMRRRNQLIHVYGALASHFRNRRDVLLAGGGYLRNNAHSKDELLAPDCIVAFGVDPNTIIARNGYIISDVGKPPDLVLDVAVQFPRPHDYDYVTRRDGYAEYGVGEFWYLDHDAWYSYQSHDITLVGNNLVTGEYVPITINRAANGLQWGHSELLDLDICWDAGRLRFFDPSAERYLPDAVELKEERDELKAEREAEKAGRLTAETEVRQLRERLRRYQE